MPANIDEMIRLAKSRNIKVNLTTNGLLLLNHIDSLIDSKLDLLSISLDAAAFSTYKKIRGNDGFNTICNSLVELVKRRQNKASKFPRIRTHFVIQKDNIDELVDFIKMSKKMGVDTVYFQPLDVRALDEQKISDLTKDMKFDKFMGKLQEGLRLAEELNIKTNLPYIIHYSKQFWMSCIKEEINYVHCMLPWYIYLCDGRRYSQAMLLVYLS